MKNGKYKTKNGSTLVVSGAHSGKSRVSFDWFEEDNACYNCAVEAYPSDDYLIWHCEECGGGSAKLTKVE